MVTAATAFVAGVTGCTRAPGPASTPTRQTAETSCVDQLRADEAKVRTTREIITTKLPELGDYEEVHWQTRALGNPCSRAPGPTDWAYQAVVKFEAGDAAKLAATGAWRPLATQSGVARSATPTTSAAPSDAAATTAPSDAAPSSFDPSTQVWPGLAPLIPAGARWKFRESAPGSSHPHVLYLDERDSLLLARFSTS